MHLIELLHKPYQYSARGDMNRPSATNSYKNHIWIAMISFYFDCRCKDQLSIYTHWLTYVFSVKSTKTMPSSQIFNFGSFRNIYAISGSNPFSICDDTLAIPFPVFAVIIQTISGSCCYYNILFPVLVAIPFLAPVQIFRFRFLCRSHFRLHYKYSGSLSTFSPFRWGRWVWFRLS